VEIMPIKEEEASQPIGKDTLERRKNNSISPEALEHMRINERFF